MVIMVFQIDKKGFCITKTELSSQDREEVMTVGFAMISIEILLMGNDQLYSFALVVGYIITIKLYVKESFREIHNLQEQINRLEEQEAQMQWIECLRKKKQLIVSAQLLVIVYLLSRMISIVFGYFSDPAISIFMLETSKFMTFCLLTSLFRARKPLDLHLEQSPDGNIHIIQPSFIHCGVWCFNVASDRTCGTAVRDFGSSRKASIGHYPLNSS
jgi:hypothetical protein